MSLNVKQKKATAEELNENYKRLGYSEEKILSDLKFSEEELHNALNVTENTNGYNVWKLRDYLVEKLKKERKEVYPSSILKMNIYFPYKKTW